MRADETGRLIGQNPLIDSEHPGDTLSNCKAVLEYVGGILVGDEHREVLISHEEANGLRQVLRTVQGALDFEADRAPVTAAKPSGESQAA